MGDEDMGMDGLIKKWLLENDINFVSLVFTDCYNGVLAVTSDTEYDMNLFLELVKYKSKFNKSRFTIIPETLTVLVHGGEAYEIIRTVRGIYSSSISS